MDVREVPAAMMSATARFEAYRMMIPAIPARRGEPDALCLCFTSGVRTCLVRWQAGDFTAESGIRFSDGVRPDHAVQATF